MKIVRRTEHTQVAVTLLLVVVFVAIPAMMPLPAQALAGGPAARVWVPGLRWAPAALSDSAAYYVDVNRGLDSNPGTIDRPFQTIQKAVGMTGPGDTVFLRQGTYRETISMAKSGSAGAPITFQAYQNERVTISGAVEVNNWSGPYWHGIFVAELPDAIDLKDENYQVFVEGKMAHRAREPEIADHDDPFSQQWLSTPMIKGLAVNIQSANGQYLRAVGRGGGDVFADADVVGPWEEFYLIDTNGGALVSGDTFGFLTNDHKHYLAAENGGSPGGSGDVLVADRTAFGPWEQFIIGKVSSGGTTIASGDRINLQAAKGGYLSADQAGGECGGGQLHANRASIGDCEKFTITIQPAPLVLFDESAVDFESYEDTWNGAYVWGPFGDKWSLGMAKIIASAPGRLTLGETDEWWNSWGWSHGHAALIGGLAALDTANEWHYEKNSSGLGGKLYYKPPAGFEPGDLTVEIRQRMWAVDIQGSHIVLRNLDFFAGQLRLLGNHNLLDNIRVTYGTHFVFRESISESTGFQDGNNGVYLDGDDNTVKDSEIAYSAGNGMVLQGEGNRVENCLIHDFGYMGTYTSGVFFNGSDAKLTHSTLFNSGRDILVLGGKTGCAGCEITYNLLHDSTLLTNDSGVIYSFGRDLQGTEIAYNWIQGVTDPSRDVSSLHLGIYLDNGSRNARVHHNLISGLANKPGVGPNTPHDGHLVCNNTIIHNRAVGDPPQYDKIGEWAYCNCNFDRSPELGNFYFEGLGECRHERDTSGKLTGVSWCVHEDWQYWLGKLDVHNTQYYTSFGQASTDLVNPLEVVTTENGWEITGQPDFRPKTGSPPVDAGETGTACDAVITEVTGQGPDLGAYEHNGTNWIPGYGAVPRSSQPIYLPVVFRNPRGRLDYQIQPFANGTWYTGVHLADMDYDGTPEVLIGNRDSSSLEIWQYQPGAGTLVRIDSLTFPNHIHDIKAADFDRDGDMDLAVGLRWWGLYYVSNSGAPGTIGSWSAQIIDAWYYAWQVLVDDLDRDGNLDIVQGVDYGPIFVYYGDGRGNFRPGADVQDTATDMRQPLGFNAVDLNGDGWLDLIGLDAVYLRAFLNPGDRTSNWASVGPATPLGDTESRAVRSQISPSAADLNGDGFIDQVANSENRPAGPNEVVIFEGSASGDSLQWTRVVLDTIPGVGWAVHAGVADLDGDGYLDIHVGGSDRFNGLRVYFGNGRGEFALEAVPLDHGVGGFNSLAVGDLNGDGLMDIVTPRFTHSQGQNAGFEVLFGQD